MTTTMAKAMKANTPLVPKFCRKKAIMKLVNTVETRLNE